MGLAYIGLEAVKPVFLDQRYIGTALLTQLPLHLFCPSVPRSQPVQPGQTSATSLDGQIYYSQKKDKILDSLYSLPTAFLP